MQKPFSAASLQELTYVAPGSWPHQAGLWHGLGAVDAHLQHRDTEAEAYYKRALEVGKKLAEPK